MNIIFLTLSYISSIEAKGIYTDLMREFLRNNHCVYIVSPQKKGGKKRDDLECDNNLSLLKLKNINNTKTTNNIIKGLSLISLQEKYKKGIKEYYKDVKFDLILYSTPPITLQKVVEYVKKRDNAKTYLLLKDIFPQNAVDLEMLKKKGKKSFIYKYFREKEIKLYKCSDYIGCMSEANVDFVLEHNTFLNNDKVEICPNSVEPSNFQIKKESKYKLRKKYNIPFDKFLFVYGGNLGKPQSIDFLIECLKNNEINSESFFLIVGDGTEYNKLENCFKVNKFNNSKLLKKLPIEEYNILVNSCDVGLIFLDKRFTIPNFPSRLLSYMNASIPILAATDLNTDIKYVLEKEKCGYWCESSDPLEFNYLVNKLCDSKLIELLGKNSKICLEENYTVKHSYNIIMNHFKDIGENINGKYNF
jgi:hypothetical protein